MDIINSITNYIFDNKTNGDDLIKIPLETLIELENHNNFYFTEKSFKYCLDNYEIDKLKFIKNKLSYFCKYEYIDRATEEGNTTLFLYLNVTFNLKPSKYSKQIAIMRQHYDIIEIINNIGTR